MEPGRGTGRVSASPPRIALGSASVGRRRRASRTLLLGLLLLVLLAPGAPSVLGGAGPPSDRAAPLGLAGAAPLPAARALASPAAMFFQNDSSVASFSQGEYCAPTPPQGEICYPQSQSPSLLSLPGGGVGLGYSEITTLNSTTCANASAQSISRIAFAVSSNGGVSFGASVFVGSSGSAACPYFQEIEPSFAVNSAGEIFAAYIGANATRAQMLAGFNPVASLGGLSAPIVGYVTRPADAVLLSTSVNDGASWSNPTVVVAGGNLSRPQIAVDGDTVYIVYENSVNSSTTLPGQPFFPSQSLLVVSSSAGATWGSPSILPAITAAGAINAHQDDTTFSPSIAIGPSGEIAIAYLTNRSCTAYCQLINPTTLAGSGVAYWGEDVVVITSTNSGATFSGIHVVAPALEPNYQGYGTVGGANSTYLFQFGESTAIAWNTATGGLYVTWSGATNLSGDVWWLNYEKAAIFEASSTNGGTSWTSTQFGPPMVLSSAITLESYYNPTIAVNDGDIYVAYSYYNNSLPCGCSAPSLSGEYSTWVSESTDGVHWSSPALAAMFPASDGIGAASYQGYTSSIVFDASGDPIVASALATAWLAPVGGSTRAIAANVTVSTIATGGTTSVTFRVAGLSGSTPWTVQLNGNNFSTAGGAISVGTVPVGRPLLVVPVVPRAPLGYDEFAGVLGSSFEVYRTSSVQQWNETTWVGLSLAVSPADTPFVALDLQGPGQSESWTWSTQVEAGEAVDTSVGCTFPWWLPIDSTVTIGPTAEGGSTYDGVYVTADGDDAVYWNGTGSGAFTGNGTAAHLDLLGPINETLWIYPRAEYNVSFVAQGAPAGDGFSYSFDGSNRSGTVGQPSIVTNVSTGLYEVGDLSAGPAPTGYRYFGRVEGGSAVDVPAEPVVNLTFAEVDVAAPVETISLHAPALTTGDEWQAEFNGTRYASSTPWINLTARPGTYPIGLFPVNAANGSSEYVPDQADQFVTFTGSAATFVAVFTVADLLEVLAGAGGTVSPSTASRWVAPGTVVDLLATPASGYGWNGWTGSGAGAYTGMNLSLRLVVDAPLEEAASFYPLPTDRFNLTIVETGIPNGTTWNLDVGGTGYAASASTLVVPGLESCQISGNHGRYPLSVPYELGDLAENLSRFVPESYPTTACGGTTVGIVFSAQFAVTAIATTGGSAQAVEGFEAVTDGTTWFAGGSTLTLLAYPVPHEEFTGWAGAGPGNYSGPKDPATAFVDGALTETAVFAPRPVVAVRYDILLNLTTPIPNGTLWTAEVNGSTYGATGSVLDISGLAPGGYTVVIDDAQAPGGLVEYRPNITSFYVLLSNDTNESFSFQTEDWVAITTIGPGLASPSSGWFPLGSRVALTATPTTGDLLSGWVGSGPGSYSGTSRTATLRVLGPVDENVTFAPPAVAVTSSPLDSLGVILGVVAAASVGLLAVGVLLARRRRPPGEGPDGGSASGPDPFPVSNPDGPSAAELGGWAPDRRGRGARSRPVLLVLIVVSLVLTSAVVLGAVPSGAVRADRPSLRPVSASVGTVTPGPSSSTSDTAAGTEEASSLYAESGLPAGTTWSLTVDGRTYRALAPSPIEAPGASAGSWAASAVSPSPGVRFAPASGPAPTGSGGGPVPVPFLTDVALNITTVPALEDPTTPPGNCTSPPFQWDDPCLQANYAITPDPGLHFYPIGSTVVLNVTPLVVTCNSNCTTNESANLTFQSWTGSGDGSVNTTSSLTTILLEGPVEETASFAVNGFCQEETLPTPGVACLTSNATLLFTESGLPSGRTWAVSTYDPTDPSLGFATVEGSATVLGTQDPTVQSETDLLPWPVPGSGGTTWEPSADPAGPVMIPQTTDVGVTYASVATPAGPYPLFAEAVGLPAPTTPWSIAVGGTLDAAATPFAEFTAPSGTVRFNGTPVEAGDGTTYEVVAVDAETLEVGVGWQNGSVLPASVAVTGPTYVRLVYAPFEEIWVGGTSGGSVTPAGERWVASGGLEALNATPDAGYEFLAWTGTGAGAYSGTAPAPTLVPYGPIHELATFRALPGPVHALSVAESGFPASQPFTVEVNGTGLTATGPVALPPVGIASSGAPSTIAVIVPPVVPNATEPTRYIPTRLSLTGGGTVTGSDGDWNVTWSGNATATVTFLTQYLVTLVGEGPGTLSPSPGSSWVDAGALLSLSATPIAPALFEGWNGTGAGAASGGATTISVLVGGAITETAAFLRPIVNRPTFELVLEAHGLAADLLWSASIGATLLAGRNPTLTFTGLNGSYSLLVPTVDDGATARYLPAGNGSVAASVTSNRTITVDFAVEYAVTVVTGSGGSASASLAWASAGTSVRLSASPSEGEVFAGWSGSAYSGSAASVPITVAGPVNETAAFAPAAPPAPSGPGGAEVLALLAILPVAFVVGRLLGRRRRPEGGAPG